MLESWLKTRQTSKRKLNFGNKVFLPGKQIALPFIFFFLCSDPSDPDVSMRAHGKGEASPTKTDNSMCIRCKSFNHGDVGVFTCPLAIADASTNTLWLGVSEKLLRLLYSLAPENTSQKSSGYIQQGFPSGHGP